MVYQLVLVLKVKELFIRIEGGHLDPDLKFLVLSLEWKNKRFLEIEQMKFGEDLY